MPTSTLRFAIATAVVAATTGGGAWLGARSLAGGGGAPAAPAGVAFTPAPAAAAERPTLRPEIERANAAFRERRYAEARALYEKLLEADPQDGTARYGLAMTLDRLGEQERAAAEYARLGFEAASARQSHGPADASGAAVASTPNGASPCDLPKPAPPCPGLPSPGAP